MTEPAPERTLTEALGRYVADLEPDPGLYAVLRRRRQRRRYAAGAGMAALAVAIPLAVTGAFGRDRGPAPGNGRPTDRAAPVRGSLAADRALVAQARYACQHLSHLSVDVDPATVRIQAAERSGDTTVVLGYLTSADGRLAQECLLTRVGGGPLAPVTGVLAGSMGDPARDAELGQRYYGADPVLVQPVLVPGHRLLLVVAPRGATAQLQESITVTAQPRAVPNLRALPLRDGAALVGASGAGQGVTIRAGGRVLARAWDDQRPAAGILPSDAEQQAMVAGARGTGDPVYAGQPTLVRLGQRERQFSIVWGGALPHGGDHVQLCAARFASGAAYLWVTVTGGHYSLGQQLGLVPPGATDHWALAWRQDGGGAVPAALVVVGPAGAVRAQARLAGGGTVAVPLHDGGGAIDWPGEVTSVSVYGPGDRLLDRRGLGEGLVDPGL